MIPVVAPPLGERRRRDRSRRGTVGEPGGPPRSPHREKSHPARLMLVLLSLVGGVAMGAIAKRRRFGWKGVTRRAASVTDLQD